MLFTRVWADETFPFPIVIDPGHGGEDIGISREGLVEKDLTFSLANRIQNLTTSRKDIVVTLTRTTDQAISFDERRKIANRAEGGIYISLHFSSIPDPARTGARIFTLAPPPPAKPEFILPIERAHVSSSYHSTQLAAVFLETFEADSISASSEAVVLPLAPLLGIEVPAILIELENLASNGASQWKNPATLEASATRIINAIDRFRAGGKNPSP